MEKPLSLVKQNHTYDNEIIYQTLSTEQFKPFVRAGMMTAKTETSVSPVLDY